MDSLSIDIETFSSVDLKKCGVYKYAESPDFEILLFGYSVDGNSVKVVDLACGETIPKPVLDALTDNSVTKWAFNAQFERVCLSKYIGVKMNADSWKCSMIWAATLGLPLSLEGVGAVLGLEKQKLTEGKELIRYFCTPARLKDGSFTRHLPSDNPERWEAFKKYNRRDVEVEIGIKEKLAKFPVSESEWINYRLDQKINDRGIMLDMPFVRSAIKCDNNIKSENIEEVQRLTGVSNPNSVTQMKDWLTGQGLEVDSLSKATVTALLETASDDVERVLMLRRQLSKSSVKKYAAMENAVCCDSRARGLIQFYGANRTGRYCLSGDHEVLTDTGWKRLDEWTGGNIACWNPLSEIVSFQNAKQLVFPYKGEMYEYEDKRISQLSTPDHKMYVKKSYGGRWTVDTVENMAHYRPSIPFTGYRSVRPGLEQEKLRVIVMIQADGHYTNDGTIKLCFTKSRKAERCKALLRSAGIIYVYNEYPQNGKTRFTFSVPSRNVPLWLRLFKDKTFDTWLFDESPDAFFDELQYWDGYRSAKNSIQYSTCNKQNADIVQAFAHITGRAASMRIKNRSAEHPNWKDAYVVDIWLTPINCHEVRNKPTVSYFDGNVYCAETKTGFFLVRRNQKVWVTGNSGRLIQVQNLPKNNIPDIAEARELVKSENYEACEMLYDCIPLVLSELIRTAFIPKKGCRFYVADFSAIEARVIAWLAGEEWRVETFKEGKDIYCASASQMFGVPVEKHGVNGHLRQKGKIAELALGYGGSVGALTAMGALDMGLSEEELKPLVNVWRQSNPKIVKLWYDIDKAVIKTVEERSKAETHGIFFYYQSGFLFIRLPSGRRLAYVKPRIGENRFGGKSVTYEGISGVKKWERLESYGAKFVENIVQAISRDILAEAMLRLDAAGFDIVMHVHDEAVIEAPKDTSLENICAIMGQTPSWAKGLLLRADGYECEFYRKD